jgi:hypothetical protein
MFRNLKSTVAALALGAFAAFPAATAKADDTAAEIRLLKERLKQLEAKVAKQERERKAAEAKLVETTPAAAGPPVMAQAPVFTITGIPGNAARPLPPSWETGGLVGLETELQGHPYTGAPGSLFINGVSITPGGFFELATVSRDKFMGAGIATPFQNIPFANIPSSHVGETHLEARRSRAALLVRGDVNPELHLSGYGEFDWLSAAQTANLNQSDSFNLRIRHLYMTLDDDYWGVHLLAGHAFTLATMNIIGILPRKENTPLTIEDQYVPGFVWDRQDQIRIVKDFDQKLWFALSVEQPATTFSGTAPTVPGVVAVLPGVTGSGTPTNTIDGNGAIVGGSQYNSINPLSLNQIPDIIGKVAYDPTIADRTIHMEAFGIFRDFTDRVVFPVAAAGAALPANTIGFINHNNNSIGDGVGGSILLPVIPKVLEAQFSGITGKGIGRYGAGQLSDVTFAADGSLLPIPETMFLTGLVWHANPGLDFYAYAGEEFESAVFGYTPLGTANFIGFGNPEFNNTGCGVETSTLCSTNVRKIQSITGGFWQDILRGPFGRLVGGVEYMYAKKFGFFGIGGEPSRDENMFYTSLRYYPF